MFRNYWFRCEIRKENKTRGIFFPRVNVVGQNKILTVALATISAENAGPATSPCTRLPNTNNQMAITSPFQKIKLVPLYQLCKTLNWRWRYRYHEYQYLSPSPQDTEDVRFSCKSSDMTKYFRKTQLYFSCSEIPSILILEIWSVPVTPVMIYRSISIWIKLHMSALGNLLEITDVCSLPICICGIQIL